MINAGRGGNVGLFQGSTTELLRMTVCSGGKEWETKGKEFVREATVEVNGLVAPADRAISAVKRPVWGLEVSESVVAPSETTGEGVFLHSVFLEDDAIF